MKISESEKILILIRRGELVHEAAQRVAWDMGRDFTRAAEAMGISQDAVFQLMNCEYDDEGLTVFDVDTINKVESWLETKGIYEVGLEFSSRHRTEKVRSWMRSESTDRRFSSVWDALGSNPDEAENMKVRSRIMIALCGYIRLFHTTQAQAAEKLGTTEARIYDLLRGKIENFGLDTLVNMAAEAGLHVEIQELKGPEGQPR